MVIPTARSAFSHPVSAANMNMGLAVVTQAAEHWTARLDNLPDDCSAASSLAPEGDPPSIPSATLNPTSGDPDNPIESNPDTSSRLSVTNGNSDGMTDSAHTRQDWRAASVTTTGSSSASAINPAITAQRVSSRAPMRRALYVRCVR
jgi:hypothetical protein